MCRQKKSFVLVSVLLACLLLSGCSNLPKEGADIPMSIHDSTGNATVLAHFPRERLENLNQNLTVFFSKSMVDLARVEDKEKLPCPITLAPKVEGKCTRTTPSVVEFIPSKGFVNGAKYTLSVANFSGSTRLLEKPYEASFSTQELSFDMGVFSPDEGMHIFFNAPMQLADLEKKIHVQTADKKQIALQISPSKDSKERFVLTPKQGHWLWQEPYTLIVDSGLVSIGGNVPSKADTRFLSSASFLSNIDGYYGEKRFYTENHVMGDFQYLPKQNFFFLLTFAKEVPLDSSLIRLETLEGKKVPAQLSYMNEEIIDEATGKTKTVVNHSGVKLMITSPLASQTKYRLVIDQKINANMGTQISREFSSSPALKVVKLSIPSYNNGCLYTTNPITSFSYEQGQKKELMKHLIISPDAKVNGIFLADQYSTEVRCPSETKYNATTQILDLRLNPKSSYSVSVTKGLMDIYGNTLEQDTNVKVKTKDIAEIDKYVYTSHPDTNLYPKQLPLVVDLQTINMQTTYYTVCSMNYQTYLNHQYGLRFGKGQATPSDLSTCITGSISVANHNRQLSHKRLDIEKDITKKKNTDPVMFVRFATTTGGYLPENSNNNDGYDRPIGKEAGSMYFRNNLLLSLEKGKNKNILFVTDLSGNIVEGLKFEAYIPTANTNNSTENQFAPTKISISYNKEKKAYELPSDMDGSSFTALVATKPGYIGFLDLNQDQFSNYDFGYIGGVDGKMDQHFAYVYTDRPIYKPGDSISFKGLLRTFTYRGYGASDVKKGDLEIVDVNNTSLKVIPVTIDKNSNFTGNFALPKEILLGNYWFKFWPEGKSEYGQALFLPTTFSVESYKKPIFKVNPTISATDISLGTPTTIDLAPQYYFGGNVVSTKGNVTITKQRYFFDAKMFSDFQFGENSDYRACLYWDNCNYQDQFIEQKPVSINNEGKGNYTTTLPSFDSEGNIQGDQIYSFAFNLLDPNTQQEVTNTVSQVVHTTDAYVGVRTPVWSDKNKAINVDAVVLDWESKTKEGAKVTFELWKQEWQDIKKEGLNGGFYHEYALKTTLEQSQSSTSASNGQARVSFTPKAQGEYLVKAIYVGANEKSFTSSQSMYVAADEYISRNNQNNSVTDLFQEKVVANEGDKHSFFLKSPVGTGQLLIFIEKDDGILDYFTLPITSFTPSFNVLVKENFYPNFYVKAFVIGTQDKNPLPVFKRALAVTKVHTEDKKLKVVVRADKDHYQPRERMQVTVSVLDSKNRPVAGANGSLAVVDESVLALKGNPQKNPYIYFYDMKRYLGVESFSSLAHLVEKLEIKDSSDGSKGGDGEQIKGGNSKKKRGVFKDTAFWLSDFTTDTKGEAHISTDPLPDNLTTRNIESLVSTTKDIRVGVGSTSVITQKLIMITENLPNTLGAGDTITIQPMITNSSSSKQTLRVSLKATRAKVSPESKEITLEAGQNQTVPFTLSVDQLLPNETQQESIISIEATAINTSSNTSKNTEIYDLVEKHLPISATRSFVTVSTMGTTTGSITETLSTKGMITDNGTFTLRYGVSALASILDSVHLLSMYPYGCFEQRISGLLPYASLSQLYNSLGKSLNLKKTLLRQWADTEEGFRMVSVDTLLVNLVSDLNTYQHTDGGFAFWTEENATHPSSLLVSMRVAQFTEQFGKLGYTIDAKAKQKLGKYLISMYQAPTFQKDASLAQKLELLDAIRSTNGTKEAATLLEALRVGKPEKLLFSDLSTYALLSAKLGNSTASDLVNILLSNNLTLTPQEAYLGKGSERLAGTAKLLETISILGTSKFSDSIPILHRFETWILSQKQDGGFGSTQMTADVLGSLSARLRATSDLKDIKGTIGFALNNKVLVNKPVNNDNKLSQFVVSKPLSELSKNNQITALFSGRGQVSYDLSMTYEVPIEDSVALDEGFVVKKNYYSYAEYQKVQGQKDKEDQEVLDHKRDRDNLTYPLSTISYLTPKTVFAIGDLVLVAVEVMTPEDRDNLALESFIPSGFDLLNPNLSTTNKEASLGRGDLPLGGNMFFEHTEYRSDRFFASTKTWNSGVYAFGYLLRATHKGKFSVMPTIASQFYHPEVFGRTSAKVVEVK